MSEKVENSWRQLSDQLLPHQIAILTAGSHLSGDELLSAAQHYVETNELQTRLAHVPVPAGTRAGTWFDDGEQTAREVYGREWPLPSVAARIIGQQDSAGPIRWEVFVEPRGGDGEMSAAEARELARALIEAAEEVDKLTGDAPPF